MQQIFDYNHQWSVRPCREALNQIKPDHSTHYGLIKLESVPLYCHHTLPRNSFISFTVPGKADLLQPFPLVSEIRVKQSFSKWIGPKWCGRTACNLCTPVIASALWHRWMFPQADKITRHVSSRSTPWTWLLFFSKTWIKIQFRPAGRRFCPTMVLHFVTMLFYIINHEERGFFFYVHNNFSVEECWMLHLHHRKWSCSLNTRLSTREGVIFLSRKHQYCLVEQEPNHGLWIWVVVHLIKTTIFWGNDEGHAL